MSDFIHTLSIFDVSSDDSDEDERVLLEYSLRKSEVRSFLRDAEDPETTLVNFIRTEYNVVVEMKYAEFKKRMDSDFPISSRNLAEHIKKVNDND